MEILPESLPYYDPRSEHRVALVIGATSGSGFFTALHLYLHGFIVYVAGRSEGKVSRAIKDMTHEAELRISSLTEEEMNERHSVGVLKPLVVNLMDLRSVEHAALSFMEREMHLDILILGSGAGAVPFALTVDGFEVQSQTNHVADVLFTQRLLGVLHAGSRVIYVTSAAHRLALLPPPDAYANNGIISRLWPDIMFSWVRYSMAKCAGMHYISLLALKHPEIRCFNVHPGFIMSTNMFTYWTRIPLVGIVFWVLFQIFAYLLGCTAEEGSYATLRCALAENVLREKNGSYFGTRGKREPAGKLAEDMDSAAATWLWTVRELRSRGYELD